MYRENKVSVNVIKQIWGCVIFQHKSLIAFKGSFFLYCSFKWRSFFKNQIIYLILLFHLSYRRASQTAFCLPQTEQGAGGTGSCADHPGSCRQLGALRGLCHGKQHLSPVPATGQHFTWALSTRTCSSYGSNTALSTVVAPKVPEEVWWASLHLWLLKSRQQRMYQSHQSHLFEVWLSHPLT